MRISSAVQVLWSRTLGASCDAVGPQGVRRHLNTLPPPEGSSTAQSCGVHSYVLKWFTPGALLGVYWDGNLYIKAPFI